MAQDCYGQKRPGTGKVFSLSENKASAQLHRLVKLRTEKRVAEFFHKVFLAMEERKPPIDRRLPIETVFFHSYRRSLQKQLLCVIFCHGLPENNQAADLIADPPIFGQKNSNDDYDKEENRI
ncbi:hypothetical protein Nepgr_006362 [Nepenthes gracilis]|uniref:Uncharacterized protein n=1 Tax=Nepenthes gracilis TaxID=150966 RepID=A0AAD3S4W4_NEPGR|nr:hypothetical protein Nepgr_006362 [Nepenthes gracilis]